MAPRLSQWVVLSAAMLPLGCGRNARNASLETPSSSPPPPIADFVRPSAGAPATPFRLEWQQVNLNGGTISPDWKRLVKPHGKTTSLVSTSTGRFVGRVPGLPYPFPPAPPTNTAVLPARIRNDLIHGDRIESFSHSARLVAIRGYKSRVYSLASGRRLWTFKTPEYGPTAFLGFSPNGRWMLTREGDQYGNNAKHVLRDAQTGKVLRRFEWTSSPYHGPLGFSVDSRRFGVFDRGVKFYEMPSGKLVFRYDGFTFGPGAVAVTNDAQTVVTADYSEESVSVWKPATARMIRSWRAHYNAAGVLAFSPGQKLLASGSDGSCGRDLVRVWDFATAKELWVIRSGYNSGGVQDVKWSPDGTLLAIAGNAGPPQILNASNGNRVAVLGGSLLGRGTQATYADGTTEHGETTLFWSNDATELWVGGKDGTRIWSRDGTFLRELKTVSKITSMARCPSGQRLVIGTEDGEIVLLHVKDAVVKWRKRLDKEPFMVAFLPSDRVVSWTWLGKQRNKIFVWDAKGGFTTQVLDAPLGTTSVAVSPDGASIACAGENGIMLWTSAPRGTPQGAAPDRPGGSHMAWGHFPP